MAEGIGRHTGLGETPNHSPARRHTKIRNRRKPQNVARRPPTDGEPRCWVALVQVVTNPGWADSTGAPSSIDDDAQIGPALRHRSQFGERDVARHGEIEDLERARHATWRFL